MDELKTIKKVLNDEYIAHEKTLAKLAIATTALEKIENNKNPNFRQNMRIASQALYDIHK